MSTLLVLGVLSVFRGNFPKWLKDIRDVVVFVGRQRIISVCIVSFVSSSARS